MSDTALTPRLESVYRFLLDFLVTHHRQPSRREVMRHFGVTPNAVQGWMEGLAKAGVILWVAKGESSRAWRFVGVELRANQTEERQLRIGFTGTRDGMTDAQKRAFTGLIMSRQPTAFGHGDCVGADDDAANVVDKFAPRCVVTVYPPEDEKLRAFNKHYEHIREPKSHFARNRDIVNDCDELIATPRDMTHQARGGTWYTVDYARKAGKPVTIVWPDGSVSEWVGDSVLPTSRS